VIDLTWQWFAFNELNVHTLYQLLRLRSEVFVVEQDCVYQDMDNRDQAAHHLLAFDQDGQVQACLRLLPPGVAYEGHAAIGRIVTSAALRGQGAGRPMLRNAIEKARQRYPNTPLKLSGQQHLRAFYESMGFKAIGEPYLEDGIPHLEMLRS
jgi:ElaA protein